MADQDHGIRLRKQRRSTSGLWQVYRIGLVSELDRLQGVEAEKIADLLRSDQPGRSWESLYEAEERLAFYRDDETVKADWSRLEVEAKALAVPSLETLSAQYRQVDSPQNRKPAYLALLHEVHFHYCKRRLALTYREEIAQWLNKIGLTWCVFGVLLVVLGVVAFKGFSNFSLEYALIFTIWTGMLGALFSRSVSMQSSLDTLTYDILKTNYSWWSVTQRMMIGGIAALVLYFLVMGGLLKGDLFPLFTAEKLDAAGLAKMVVWSFLIGFSERLLPDQLSRLEKATQPPPATPKPSN